VEEVHTGMVDSKAWITQNIDLMFLVVIGLLLLVLLFFIINTVRLNQVRKRYRTLMKGQKHANLEELLFQYAHNVQRLEANVGQAVSEQEQMKQDIYLSPGPVAIVRYNAFPDAGSDLSYSIAILNRAGDGVVVSSIFGREESRTYGKPVIAGASTYALSDEEKEAIAKAMGHR
jgi:hypothetical protein